MYRTVQEYNRSFSDVYSMLSCSIQQLESHLSQYGYERDERSLPPKEPKELLKEPYSLAKADEASPKGSGHVTTNGGWHDDRLTPTDLDIRLSFDKYARNTGAMCRSTQNRAATMDHVEGTAMGEDGSTQDFSFATVEALAPMTAAKLRSESQLKDSPSSLSSIGTLSPSIASLVGKYAAISRNHPSSVAKSPLPPLSPAFAAAQEEQKKKIMEQENDPYNARSTHQTSTAYQMESNVGKGTAGLMDNMVLSQSRNDQVRDIVPSMMYSQRPMDAGYARELNEDGDVAVVEEESTIELKAQVIFNAARHGLRGSDHRQSPMLWGDTSLQDGISHFRRPFPVENAQVHVEDKGISHERDGESAHHSLTHGEGIDDAPSVFHKHGVQRNSLPEAQGGSDAVIGYNPIQPSQTNASMGTTPAYEGSKGQSSSSLVKSAHSLTPSLPTVVARYKAVDTVEYLLLPKFIRGQISLENLNEASVAVHQAAQRRCSSGGVAFFSMDDVETTAAPFVPSGKVRVLLNALAKLDRIQVKVVYGQGTVYFFKE